MNTVNHHTEKKQTGFGWLPIVVVVLLAIVVVWVQYKFKDEKRFAVVKLYGDGAAMNISKNFNLTEFAYGEKNRGAFLAETGDVVSMSNSIIHFKDAGSDSMQVKDEGDSLVFVNGKVNSILISRKENLIPWFQTMNAASLSGLQNICFNSKIPASYIPFLKEIARVKPKTGLCFNEYDSLDLLSDYITQANFFDPLFIKASITQQQIPLLSHWKNLECLYLEILDSVVTIPLPGMPALKQCIIYGDELEHMPSTFFSSNTQLEKLTLITALDNYAMLQPLNKLQEIAVNNPGDSADVSVLRSKFNNLSVLILSGWFSKIDSLVLLKKLRWLGLPENTSQQQFNNIAAQLKDLQVLEIKGNEFITNLQPLQHLPNLKGLVITDTVTDKQALYALKELRYLSVPAENKADSTYLFALQKTLPGCIVVPNSGACLGSGWMLLLLPLVFLFALFFQKKSA